MTRNEIIRNLLIYSAALQKENAGEDLLFAEFQKTVKEEVLENPTFLTYQKNNFDAKYVFVGEQGTIPTRKGWATITPKVVVKKPNPRRIPQEKIVGECVDLMQEVCYRYNNHPAFKSHFDSGLGTTVEAYNCLSDTIVKAAQERQEMEAVAE